MNASTFGVSLLSLREVRGETQAAMARNLGVTPSYVGKLERDEYRPSRALITTLAVQYGLELRPWLECAGYYERPDQPAGSAPAAAGITCVELFPVYGSLGDLKAEVNAAIAKARGAGGTVVALSLTTWGIGLGLHFPEGGRP